jgi:hypothetical protein
MTAATTAPVIEARLLDVAAALGGRPPPAAARIAIRRLAGACHAAAYPGNALNPGGAPIELSFAEGMPTALRFDLAPEGPDASATQRQESAVRLADVRPVCLLPWREFLAPTNFGGFVSAVISDDGRTVSTKAYLELGRARDAVTRMPLDLCRGLVEAVPGLVPHFVALSGRGAADSRVYFECANGLSLPTIVDWAAAHGLMAQALAAAQIACRLTGGGPILPEAGVLCAVRRAPSGCPELKLELTSAALGPDGAEAIAAVFAERPDTDRAFRAWSAAIGQPVTPTVVSVRIGRDLVQPRLNVYTGLVA